LSSRPVVSEPDPDLNRLRSRRSGREIPAIAVTLDTDEAAFRAAVLENTNRKTYSDIDRAHILLECRKRQLGDDALPMDLLGLKERQRKHLLSLLKLPKTVQDAIDDPDSAFKGTHGLALHALKGHFPSLDYGVWIKRVNDEALSVAKMKRAVRKQYATKGGGAAFSSLFRESGTNAKRGEFRFNPVSVKVGDLSDDEKKKLREELETMLKALG
jgi:ParB-like chromosome segregation protein Spo0J